MKIGLHYISHPGKGELTSHSCYCRATQIFMHAEILHTGLTFKPRHQLSLERRKGTIHTVDYHRFGPNEKKRVTEYGTVRPSPGAEDKDNPTTLHILSCGATK
jgi:hypothetical protein